MFMKCSVDGAAHGQSSPTAPVDVPLTTTSRGKDYTQEIMMSAGVGIDRDRRQLPLGLESSPHSGACSPK